MSNLGEMRVRVPRTVARALDVIGAEKVETHLRAFCAEHMPKKPRTGDIIAWIVIDPDTREQVFRCETRAEARDMAHASGARFCKLEVSK
jgi:hypothetical protein